MSDVPMSVLHLNSLHPCLHIFLLLHYLRHKVCLSFFVYFYYSYSCVILSNQMLFNLQVTSAPQSSE